MITRWKKLGEEPVYVGFRSFIKRTFEKARIYHSPFTHLSFAHLSFVIFLFISLQETHDDQYF